MSRLLPRAAVGFVVLTAILLALTGCGAVSDVVPRASETATSVPKPAIGVAADTTERAVGDLNVGDCFTGSGADLGGTARTVHVVSCSTVHGYEVYAAVLIAGAGYPGDDAVAAAAESGCGSRFEGFAGRAYADSELDFTYVTPSEQGWKAPGKPEALCLIYDPAGEAAGSLRGAGR